MAEPDEPKPLPPPPPPPPADPKASAVPRKVDYDRDSKPIRYNRRTNEESNDGK